MRLEHAPPPALDLVFDADPFLGRAGRRLRVEVLAGTRRAALLDYDGRTDQLSRRVALPASCVDAAGELLLTWRMSDPTSPAALGLSADRRPLGPFLRRAAVVPRGDAPG